MGKRISILRRAFTTIELLAVIATIIVLASLVLPAFSKSKRSVLMNQSRMQFTRYVGAMRAYYKEYGYFPRIISSTSDLTNESVITLGASSSKNLIMALSGKETDGVTDLSSNNSYLNPNGIQFLEFSDDDFYDNNGTIDRTCLADRFNNTNINLVVENPDDTNAVIPQSVFSSYSTIKTRVPSSGLREKVAFFTVGNNDRSIDVVSW